MSVGGGSQYFRSDHRQEVGGAGHSKQKQQQPTPIHQDQIYQNVNAFWTLTPVLNGTHA